MEASGGYAAPSEDVPVYASGEEELGGYVEDGAASDQDAALAMLQGSIPGVPGEDYPIYSEVPETAFSCEGQVDGGKIEHSSVEKSPLINNTETAVAHFLGMLHRFVICQKMLIGVAHFVIWLRSM